MRADGKAIVIITHKLHEVMSLSDKVAVLRKGQYIGTVNTSETNPQALTDMMVGHAVTLNIDRPRYENPVPRLTLQDVTCYDNEGVVRLDHVSFTAMGGEILGVAGIAGSGQRELLESIAGLYPVAEGSSIRYTPEGAPESELVGKTPMQIKKSGVALAFVPEDRLGMGLVGSMGMTGNMMLRSWKKGKGVFVNRKDPNELAMNIWKELEVVTPSTEFPVRRMSGGNVQKVLVGREIASAPSVLMTAYAVRGLDINTSYTIYNLMTEQKMKGVAVIFVGEDLDVLLELCDRILVLCGGKVSGIVDARTHHQGRDRPDDDPRRRKGGKRSMNNENKVPLIRLAKRDMMEPWKVWCIRLASIVLALLLGGLVMMIALPEALPRSTATPPSSPARSAKRPPSARPSRSPCLCSAARWPSPPASRCASGTSAPRARSPRAPSPRATSPSTGSARFRPLSCSSSWVWRALSPAASGR